MMLEIVNKLIGEKSLLLLENIPFNSLSWWQEHCSVLWCAYGYVGVDNSTHDQETSWSYHAGYFGKKYWQKI